MSVTITYAPQKSEDDCHFGIDDETDCPEDDAVFTLSLLHHPLVASSLPSFSLSFKLIPA